MDKGKKLPIKTKNYDEVNMKLSLTYMNISKIIFLLPFLITQLARGAGYFNGWYVLVVMIILFKIYNSRKK